MSDFLVESDGEATPADSVLETEELVLGLLRDGMDVADITVSKIIREKLVIVITGVELKTRSGQHLV